MARRRDRYVLGLEIPVDDVMGLMERLESAELWVAQVRTIPNSE
jgi:hypothetical protein